MPTNGKLLVRVTTDMSVPKDIDSIALQVVVNNQEVHSQKASFGPGGPTLPLEVPLALKARTGSPVRIRAVAYRDRVPTVLSQTTLAYPEGGRTVEVPLQFLCRGPKSVREVASNGAPVPTCPSDQTCLGGRCVPDSTVVESGIVDEPLFVSAAQRSSCFDPASCFEKASVLTPFEREGECWAQLPDGLSGPMAFGLWVAGSDVGFCNHGECHVPLAEGRDPDRVLPEAQRLRLPWGACGEDVRGVVVSTACGAIKGSRALCSSSESASVGGPPGGSATDDGPAPKGALDSGTPADGETNSADGGTEPSGGEGGSAPTPPEPGFLKGRVDGLTKEGLLLSIAGETAQPLSPGTTSFSSAKRLDAGTPYSVRVAVQPAGLFCTVENGEGTLGDPLAKPIGVSCKPVPKAVQIAAGVFHSCVVLESGGLRCWGNNNQLVLGESSPNNSVPGLVDVVQVAAGGTRTCVLRKGGNVRCWGRSRWDAWASWDQDFPGVSGALGVATGGEYECVILSDRTVRCWGSYPKDPAVPGTAENPFPGLSGVRELVARREFMCAVLENGHARCWGQDTLSNTSTGSVLEDLPGMTGVVQMSGGEGFACAVLESATVRCWRNNPVFVYAARKYPVTEPLRVPADTVRVMAGNAELCGLSKNHTLWCLSTASGSPTRPFVASLSGVVDVGMASQSSCALLEDGTLRCWGSNQYGMSGVGSPVPVVVGLSGIAEIATGQEYTCARLVDGSMRCWGRLPYGAPYAGGMQTPMVGLEDTEQLSLGYISACVLQKGGRARCWGQNSYGILGLPAGVNDGPLPLQGVKEVRVGVYQSCALLEDGSVRCWGVEGNVSRGGGNIGEPLAGLSGVVQVATGSQTNCVLFHEGTVRCWGEGVFRGPPTSLQQNIAGLSGVRRIAMGNAHICALMNDRSLRCWGDNTYAQLAGSDAFKPIVGLSGVVQVSASPSGSHTCVLLDDGTVRCWGRNDLHQTGDGSPSQSLRGLRGIVQVSAGASHSCALSSDGTAACWGDDIEGEISGNANSLRIFPLGP